MSVTLTNRKEFSAGGFKAVVGLVTVGGALTSGAIATGLEVIYGGSMTPNSAATDDTTKQIRFNTGSGNTTINGEVKIVSCTAGDDFNVFLIGR